MKLIKFIGIVAALAITGCSTAMWQTYIRNDLSGLCDNPTNVLSNVPLMYITQQQALVAVGSLCTGAFGTSAAPTPAPGMTGTFPAPSAASTPAAAIAK